ncbi:MAG: bifunctional phosphoribosyl-AMP cyclohydrolase/phosphoribosyl-ATP diphosphatase HisIE [Deltaproteobacteria bacterium]|nr:bifunctional phosphoribosyl-AMP cyclohydrolase/phosphoribosyl-ATP diphosphatase HisIE [Deltaproteobacteria bacterium]
MPAVKTAPKTPARKNIPPKAPPPERIRPAKLIARVRFDEKGLVPVAVVDRETGELLMLAWANRRALELAIKTGFTHFWSRSRGSLWKKGGTTGHVQRIESLELDCDGDTLIARVDQTGVACHTGAPTCFYQTAPFGKSPARANSRVLFELLRTIRTRRTAKPDSSYTAKLLSQSAEKRGKKLLEEASELLLATADLEKAGKGKAHTRTASQTKAAVIYEAADVLYHFLVVLEGAGIPLTDMWGELDRRFGMSGIQEKKQRRNR